MTVLGQNLWGGGGGRGRGYFLVLKPTLMTNENMLHVISIRSSASG